VGSGTQVGVLPMFRGHHAVFADALYQADVCNNVDDVVVGDWGNTGVRYRFPIDAALMPWLAELITAMNEQDKRSGSPWQAHNAKVRLRLLNAAKRRLGGATPQSLSTFEPGLVAPALHGLPSMVDDSLTAMIAARGDTRIPGQ
jgi:hypothetical protein